MKYPALWIANEGSFGVADTPLRDTNWRGFHSGFFDGLRFFDSAGTEWVVERAVRTSAPGIFDRILNRRMQVELQFAPPRQASLAEVAEHLCSCVDRDPADLFDQFVTHAELKGMFRSAISADQLIQLARTLGEPVATTQK